MAAIAKCFGIDELALQILGEVYEDSPRSIFNTTLVSRRFHMLSNEFMYRCLPLTFSRRRHEANIRLFDRLQEDEVLRKKILQLRIANLFGDVPDELIFENDDDRDRIYLEEQIGSIDTEDQMGIRDQLSKLFELIPMVKNLADLIWDVETPVPERLLSTISSHLLESTVVITCLPPYIPYLGSSPLGLVSASSCLSVYHSVRFEGDTDKLITTVWPKLRMLTLVNETDDHTPPDQIIRRMPNLEDLEIHYFDPNGFEELWKGFCGWMKLRRLSITDTGFIRLLQPQLTALRSLQVLQYSDIGFTDNLRYLLKAGTLESLSLCDFRFIMDKDIVESLGRSLRSLELYHPSTRVFLTETRWLKHFTQLNSLRVNLILDGKTWPPANLDAIANSVPSLTQLHLGVGMNPRADFPSDRCCHNALSVSRFWTFLWDTRERIRRENAGKPGIPQFELLTLHGKSYVGMIRPFPEGLPHRRRPLTLDSACNNISSEVGSQTFTVRLSERDDEKVLGMAVATSSLIQDEQKRSREMMTTPDIQTVVGWEEEVLLPTLNSDSVHFYRRQKKVQSGLLDFFFASERSCDPKAKGVIAKVLNNSQQPTIRSAPSSSKGQEKFRQSILTEFYVLKSRPEAQVSFYDNKPPFNPGELKHGMVRTAMDFGTTNSGSEWVGRPYFLSLRDYFRNPVAWQKRFRRLTHAIANNRDERLGAGKQADLSKDTTSILSKDMNMGVSLEDRADNVSVTFTMTGAAAK